MALPRAQLGPGDAHPVSPRRAQLRGEVDDVVLYALELVLLGRLHVHHGVLVHVLLQDHRLGGDRRGIPRALTHMDDFHQTLSGRKLLMRPSALC